MPKVFRIEFRNGHTARAVTVAQTRDLAAALDALGLAHPVPVLVLVGGAGSLAEADLARLRPLFVDVLAPVAESIGASVVDGGTSAGVMRLIGEAREKAGRTFPLVGVAAEGTIMLPGATTAAADAAALDQAHSHFVLVPGAKWGDEVAWISKVATELAGAMPSLTVLVSGGSISYDDVDESIQAGRPVLAIAGSGGTADVLASALAQSQPSSRARGAVESGLLWAVAPDSSDHSALVTRIRNYLSGKGIEDGRDEHV